MVFDPAKYGTAVVRILALDGDGNRLAPLTIGPCSNAEARRQLAASKAAELFRESETPYEAMAGLWLYFSCFDEAHELANDSNTKEGYLWHAIVHRQEGDSGNSAYWYRRAGSHSIFSELALDAAKILEQYPGAEFRSARWDPFAFVSFVDRARQQPGSQQERAALEIQRAEWQILFDHCARPAA